MIPEKLSLTNFMCYGEAELDFAGIHLACLAGDNGAGKSALLDAMTWALWGHSRLGARGDDDLIRLGRDSMRVELTFQLGGETYRVLRRRESGKRSQTLLDFQVRDGGRWRTLVDGGVRATQQRIENVLRLDHDTFVNSAFLRQGRADEFTVKTAAERKRVLGEILGLDRWAAYEERVKERQRAIEAETEAIRLRLAEIDAELDRREAYRAQRAEAQAAVDQLSEALEDAQQAYQAIEAARAELRHVKGQASDQEMRIERAERELAGLAEERAEREQRLEACEELLARQGEIEAGYKAYRDAVELEQRLGEKLRESVELDERRRELVSEISEARHRLEAQRDALVKRIGQLEGRLPGPELLEELEDVGAKLEHMARLAESREAAKDDVRLIAEKQAELRARNEGLRQEMGELKERIEVLQQAGAECPLCEQPLTEEHRVELLDDIQREGRAKGDQYRANVDSIEVLDEQASALEVQIAQCDSELQEVGALQRRAAALTERLEQGATTSAEVEDARETLAKLEERLETEDYAPGSRADLERVIEEAEKLGYDSDAHQQAREAVSEGQVYAERRAQLETVQTRLEEEEAGLGRLAESRERWQVELAAARERRDALTDEGQRLIRRLEGAGEAEAQLQRMRAREAEARQKLGAAEQRLAACEALEQQRADKVERKEALAREEGIYADLRTAFGVRGVPAMIIEAAVPEIESEANRLLSRMTSGRMHVRFDTQRETKAGEVREALEIQISDELGTRPYENYSGGEQFRVNFAIRIALSKLLARRAGAQLQTLVIDEGFGTQDAQGRQRLVEAINAIQDDFARVLVITHISSLKDAFPVRIEVTKTPDGSTIDVV